ncbi:MAG TPA: hypothetical protein VIO64_07155 [Pseudobacteroides sp.]|uniref:hypothetical protein n=1 Tax=Pseudobacteroides sp. TaxID=1968840 RepID=UPI002F9449CE
MIYTATLKKIDSTIEGEIVLEVNGIELTGFVSYFPHKIEENKQYQVSIGFAILDDVEIKEIFDEKGFERINDSLSYYVKGLLKQDGTLDAGIIINDENLFDYADLHGKYIQIKVDRLSVEFVN